MAVPGEEGLRFEPNLDAIEKFSVEGKSKPDGVCWPLYDHSGESKVVGYFSNLLKYLVEPIGIEPTTS